MSSEIAIRCHGLSKSYGIYASNADRLWKTIVRSKKTNSFQALKPLDLEIKRGEFFGIIGKNGSGKSTLLQVISGIIPPTSGSVEVHGRIAAMLELGSGFNPDFTGRENVKLNAQILGLSNSEIARTMPEIEKFADIGEFIDRPVMTYSSGMFVRLAFAVQTAINPDILIIDEALAVGDIFFRKKCYDRLNVLKDNGTTVILVTHSSEDIMFYCNRALLLNNGEALFCGDTTQAVNMYYELGQISAEAQEESSQDDYLEADLEGAEHQASLQVKWPVGGTFSAVDPARESGDVKAACMRIRLQDASGIVKNVFRQGETMQILVEYKALANLGSPCGGFVIRTDKGVIVHGKHTAQTDSAVPSVVPEGSILRFVHEVKLDISVGEYLVDLGFSSFRPELYKLRNSISSMELEGIAERHSVATGVINFSVASNAGGGYANQPFYGLAGISSVSHLFSSTSKTDE